MSDFLTSNSLRSVEKLDKSTRRMTVDPNDLLNLDLDNDEEEEEEMAMHTTRSEPGVVKKARLPPRKRGIAEEVPSTPMISLHY